MPDPGVPLACFGIGAAPRQGPLIDVVAGERPYWCSPWRLDTDVAQHRAAVLGAQQQIAAGNIYQANLTSRARATVRGDLAALYADLVHAQHASHNALLEFADLAVLSVSPELFLDWSPPCLRCQPMKGTARRGPTPAKDALAATRLSESGKDIAENVMIVDLVRNDLGRIARTGTVEVPRLGIREPFAGVWQLSSEVACEPRPDIGLVEVLRALYPSGSITGAPKRAAMSVIRDRESGPRGVYCGAVGWLAPPGYRTRARFNVAIHTAVVQTSTGAAVYGAGGGITIDSDPGREYQEMLDKTEVLAVTQDTSGLELWETLAYSPDTGLRHVSRHLDRLAGSAAYFGFPFDRTAAVDLLQQSVHGQHRARVRLQLCADGGLAITLAPLPDDGPTAVRLAVDTVPIRSDSLWLRHKTNRRSTYDAARARHPNADDVVLTNQDGHVTETSIANIAVRIAARWYTPPLESGCLPGIGRAIALDQHRITERHLSIDDLHRSTAIAVISSLRGWRPATLT